MKEQADISPIPAADRSSAAPTVLLVEDEPCMTHLYTNLLRKEGYTVEHCADGEAALQALEKNRFDAVVLDLMMPKIDGLQVLKTIRTLPRNRLIPVIVVTAARLKVAEDEALRFGAKLYLDKGETAKMIEGLRKIMSERPANHDDSLRMAPLTAIEEKPPRFTRMDVPLAEPPKPATPIGLARLFGSRNA
jgi:CheY-like chemotaxis protein